MATGGCLCGAVRFEAEGPLRDVIFCHCSQCRRQTGLYVAATAAPQDRVTVQGADRVTWFAASASARRGFCGTCGSLLFWQRNGSPNLSILAGAFDDPALLTPGYHICTEGRAGFYAINDGLPQHADDGVAAKADVAGPGWAV